MTRNSKFIQEDLITGRRRLGPLAWIVIFITILFVLAGLLGYFQFVMRNVSRLESQVARNGSPTRGHDSETLPTPVRASTPTVAASRSITWTVWPTLDVLTGRSIYEGPAEIKQWAIRDYQSGQKWMLDHLFEKDYLLAHLAEYYSGQALEMERQSIIEAFDKTNLIWAPLIAQPRRPPPLDQPLFETFSMDGRQMTLSDYTDSGTWKQYHTRTRRLIPSKAHRFLWTYTLEYDPTIARWKVARLRLIYDIDANQPAYTNEP